MCTVQHQLQTSVCRQRGGWMCESLWGSYEIFFYFSETQEVLLPRRSISFNLSSTYITLWLCGGYMLHAETQIQTEADIPHMHTQGNKVQLWQFASCPTENNHRRIHFEVHHLFTVCAPFEAWFVIVKSFPLSPQWFTKPPCISVLRCFTSSVISNKSSFYLNRKNKGKQNNKMWLWFSTNNTLDFTYSCISLFSHLNHAVCVTCFVLGWCLFYNRSSIMQIPGRHSNFVCQSLSLNLLFWVNIHCVNSLYIHTHLGGNIKECNFSIINISLIYL